MIKIKVFAFNAFREATYVVYDNTNEAVVIDAGLSTSGECDRFNEFIAKNNLKIVKLINTHCHVDHVTGVGYLQEKYNVPFCANKLEEQFIAQFEQTAQMYGIEVPFPAVKKIDEYITEGTIIEFGESKLKVITTPGHTEGGVVFYDEQSKSLFTGDTLFKGSIGRTDLQGGSYQDLMTSILKKIVPIGKDITIYPGHGDHTTLTEELMYNPFITDVLNGEVAYE